MSFDSSSLVICVILFLSAPISWGINLPHSDSSHAIVFVSSHSLLFSRYMSLSFLLMPWASDQSSFSNPWINFNITLKKVVHIMTGILCWMKDERFNNELKIKHRGVVVSLVTNKETTAQLGRYINCRDWICKFTFWIDFVFCFGRRSE